MGTATVWRAVILGLSSVNQWVFLQVESTIACPAARITGGPPQNVIAATPMEAELWEDRLQCSFHLLR